MVLSLQRNTFVTRIGCHRLLYTRNTLGDAFLQADPTRPIEVALKKLLCPSGRHGITQVLSFIFRLRGNKQIIRTKLSQDSDDIGPVMGGRKCENSLEVYRWREKGNNVQSRSVRNVNIPLYKFYQYFLLLKFILYLRGGRNLSAAASPLRIFPTNDCVEPRISGARILPNCEFFFISKFPII